MSLWRFDNDIRRFSFDTPTWDAGLFAGTAELTLENGGKVFLELANVRTEQFTYDRNMFRSPYGTVWHQQGDARRLVESITVQAHILDDEDGISDAAIDADAIGQVLRNVTRVESEVGIFEVAGLQSYTRQPVQSGYRFDIRFVVFDGIQ
jgi:hypothetical protein